MIEPTYRHLTCDVEQGLRQDWLAALDYHQSRKVQVGEVFRITGLFRVNEVDTHSPFEPAETVAAALARLAQE